VIPGLTPNEWQAFLDGHPEAHLLQSKAWGELKSSFGWDVARVQSGDSGAQILFRRFFFGLTIGYIPMGPIGPWTPPLISEIDNLCHAHRAVLLKIEPDHVEDKAVEANLLQSGFQPSRHTIQPRRTLIIDLDGGEDDILARMSQKTRYNVRLAGRRGVQIEPWSDVEAFSRMMIETGERDAFGVHSYEYYHQAYSTFDQNGNVTLQVALFEGKPLAAVMVFARGSRAWYLYGASSGEGRQHMPTYLLQWEAIRWALSRGCRTYDLWGIPDHDLEDLEKSFANRNDGLWGVYRFKRGFGGRVVRSTGAWDRPYNRTLYTLYRLFVRARRN
jgi:lipid II:glycine glycyltransferase (peptidoglycan interpeptide bridge formation enzyme)